MAKLQVGTGNGAPIELCFERFDRALLDVLGS